MKYGTFIFDFDYTLADATEGIVQSVNYALNKMGFEPKDRETIRKFVGMTVIDGFCYFTGVSDKEAAKAFAASFKEMADKVMTENTFLFDDTIEVLSNLKELGLNTAIVSTKFRYRINKTLEKYDMADLVDYIVGSEDVIDHKPSPEGLLKVIEHFNVPKESALYIGDHVIDANAAKRAQIDFAAMLTGTTKAEEFEGLPKVCKGDSLREIMTTFILS